MVASCVVPNLVRESAQRWLGGASAKVRVDRRLPRKVRFGTPLLVARFNAGESELGGAVSKLLRHGEVDDVAAVVLLFRYIDDSKVLLSSLPLLQDERETPLRLHPSGDYLRICDIVLAALAERTALDLGVPRNLWSSSRRLPPRFSRLVREKALATLRERGLLISPFRRPQVGPAERKLMAGVRNRALPSFPAKGRWIWL